MKILLIRPPYDRLREATYGPYFPLGLGYVASVLHKNGLDVKVYNADNPLSRREYVRSGYALCFSKRMHGQDIYAEALQNNQHYVWAEIKETLEYYRPDIVGLTVLSVAAGAAAKVSSLCKHHDPDCQVIWGGAHPTIMPGAVMRNQHVDFVIRGEGEYSFLELCQILKGNGRELSSVDGLSYRGNRSVVHNAPRKMVKTLDDIPFPARNLVLFPERYDKRSWGHIIGTRGCPYNCAFCSAKALWGKPRYRSTENIIDEINDVITRFKSREFWFQDDTLTTDRRRMSDLCNKIASSNLRITWKGTTRADRIDAEMLDSCKRAGCCALMLGIESGSDRILRLLKKGISVEQVETATNLLDKGHVGYGAFFMGGFPEETKEDLQRTLDLMQRIHPIHMSFNIFTPLPGSELYDKVKSLGLMPKAPYLGDMAYGRSDNYFIKNVSTEDFIRLKNDILAYVDSYNRSWKTVLRRIIYLHLPAFKCDPFYLITFLLRPLRRLWTLLSGRVLLGNTPREN